MLNKTLRALAMALAVVSAPLATWAQTKWVLPVGWSTDSYHTQNLQIFTDEVDKETGGKLKISIYANGSLFKVAELKRAVQQGQAQMGQTLASLYENEDPIFGLDTIPFLATSYRQARWLADLQRPLLEKKLQSQRLKFLFSSPWNPQGLFSIKPVGGIQDLKGIKWRSYNPTTARLSELLGAQSVMVMTSELPQALATGMMHALVSSVETGYETKIWEQVGYFYDLHAWLPKNIAFVNQKAFDALDKPTQDVVLAAAKRAEERGWKLSEEKAAWYMEQVRSHGMKVEPGSADLNKGFRALGEKFKADWVQRAGPEGAALLDAYAKLQSSEK